MGTDKKEFELVFLIRAHPCNQWSDFFAFSASLRLFGKNLCRKTRNAVISMKTRIERRSIRVFGVPQTPAWVAWVKPFRNSEFCSLFRQTPLPDTLAHMP